jgi:hypothetical protein
LNKPRAILDTENKPLSDITTKVLRLDKPPPLEDIPSLCNKIISSIVAKANLNMPNPFEKRGCPI